jgi:hypothetical protein
VSGKRCRSTCERRNMGRKKNEVTCHYSLVTSDGAGRVGVPKPAFLDRCHKLTRLNSRSCSGLSFSWRKNGNNIRDKHTPLGVSRIRGFGGMRDSACGWLRQSVLKRAEMATGVRSQGLSTSNRFSDVYICGLHGYDDYMTR